MSDRSGAYEIADLPPGKYSVWAEKQSHQYKKPASTVTLNKSGCAVRDFGLWPQNFLAGAIFDSEGEPVKDLQVFLRHEDAPPHRSFGDEQRTDSEGRFRFDEMPPGSYYLAVSPMGVLARSPFDRVFFGGTDKKDDALLIRIAADSQLTGQNIMVGERYATRKVQVRIRWPDGSPAVTGFSCDDLTADETGRPYSGGGWAEDEAGASCTILGDRPHRIRVGSAPELLPSEELIEPREAIVQPGVEDVELTFVLSEADFVRSRRFLDFKAKRDRFLQEMMESSSESQR